MFESAFPTYFQNNDIVTGLFHWIQFTLFWIKGQEVTLLFKFSWIAKGENKNIFLMEKF